MEHATCRRHMTVKAIFYCEECGFTCVECSQNEKHNAIALNELNCLFPDICKLIEIKNRHATLRAIKINMITCINQLHILIRRKEAMAKEKICNEISNKHITINATKLIKNIHSSTIPLTSKIPINEMDIFHKLDKAIKDWELINKAHYAPLRDIKIAEVKSEISNKNLDAIISQISSSKDRLGIGLRRSIR